MYILYSYHCTVRLYYVQHVHEYVYMYAYPLFHSAIFLTLKYWILNKLVGLPQIAMNTKIINGCGLMGVVCILWFHVFHLSQMIQYQKHQLHWPHPLGELEEVLTIRGTIMGVAVLMRVGVAVNTFLSITASQSMSEKKSISLTSSALS